jgi:hypothetical protein
VTTPADGTDPFGNPYQPPPPPLRGLDPIGWCIVNLHQLLGHAKAAAVLGQDPGDPGQCLICTYERTMDPDDRAAVVQALGVPL